MVTIQSEDDAYEEVERGLDWLERLENIKARRDRESAMRETVKYVDRLRDALTELSEDIPAERIVERHGQEIADLIESVKESGANDPWLDYLKPALLED